jgi:hypothetical protein
MPEPVDRGRNSGSGGPVWTTGSGPSARETERDSTIDSMVAGRKLRAIDPIPKYQQDLINQCGETIAGAQAANTASPKVAFNAAYDAMRLAVDAHMNAHGYRVESGEGGHAHRVRYAELTMTDILANDDIAFYRASRQVRHRTEYPEPNNQTNVTPDAAQGAIEVAKRFHVAVTAKLKPKPKTM